MPAKPKITPAGGLPRVSAVRRPALHDVTNQTAAINAASRRRMTAVPPAARTANQFRQPVSKRAHS